MAYEFQFIMKWFKWISVFAIKSRTPLKAVTFDGIEYAGSIVNMGVRNEDGSICYIIGMLKSIRKQLGKADGDTIHVCELP